ncbi:MAG: 2-C-methyl-D-erythritol 4-phosphate cytidylyltransferase, partial [Rhodobacteraceae bacterium]|nr:2-C-methyl-D-erythritol 4-phosphate cytidylyltransferase [Paracoccaceae bacterium]
MTTAVIIVAAGRGSRAGGAEPKQWQALAGQSVLERSVAAFAGIGRILLVLHPEEMVRGLELFGGSVTLIAGGATRSASVRNALEALQGTGITQVLIHDGARPLVPRGVIAAVLAALGDAQAAAPALPVTDALWRGAGGRVQGAEPREGLWRAQTPQGFAYDAILAAHRAFPEGAADDVEIALRAGLAVDIIPGAEDNLKITWPEDFTRAERILGA